jgi:hypothetical protein
LKEGKASEYESSNFFWELGPICRLTEVWMSNFLFISFFHFRGLLKEIGIRSLQGPSKEHQLQIFAGGLKE